MATRVPALIQLSDPRVAAQLVFILRAGLERSKRTFPYTGAVMWNDLQEVEIANHSILFKLITGDILIMMINSY